MKKILVLPILALALCLISAGKKTVSVHLCGDEFVAETAAQEAGEVHGWGAYLGEYLLSPLVVDNCATAGASSKSFVKGGRWDYMSNRLKKNDWVLLQFGLNDIADDDHVHSSVSEYEQNLLTMADEAMAHGGKVIIATPVAIRYYKNGEFRARMGAYPEATRRVAASLKVPLIDLEAATTEWLKGMSEEESQLYYADDTHLTEAGAREVSRMAARLLRDAQVKKLSDYIRTTL